MSTRYVARLLPLLALLALAGARAQLPLTPPSGDQKPAVITWPSAPVVVNDTAVFTLYDETKQAAQDRADVVSLRLQNTTYHMGGRPLPKATVRSSGSAVTLYLDEHPIVTVSDTDAEATGKTKAALADKWSGQINQFVQMAYREQQPGYMREAIIGVALWVALGILLTFALLWVKKRWLHNLNWPIFVLLWGLVVRVALYTFPRTRAIDTYLWQGPFRPLLVVTAVILLAVSVARIWSDLLRHILPVDLTTLSPEERTERVYRRRATLVAVARITGVTIIWVFAGFLMLSRIGVNLPALVASAGLIGVAFGLAAQDSMKDIVSGINILLDDRFGVGDTIDTGDYSGRVVRLNLRVTQIRDMSGRLITVPNRNIVNVANETSRWAQVDLKVKVPYATDLRQAMKTLTDTANGLKDEWPERITEDPVMLGVDSLADNGVTLRMTIKTTPGDQWAVGRELRLRLKEAFDQASIRLVVPVYDVTITKGM